MPQQNTYSTVPIEGSNEDIMLQNCELKINPNDEKYPSNALHVYAQEMPTVMNGIHTN